MIGTCSALVVALALAGVRAAEPKQPTTAPVDMTASDVGVSLTRMLLDKPKVPITAPLNVAPPTTPVEVPLEGSMVIDRLCRLTRDEKTGWALLTFEPEPGRRKELPRVALPSRLLEQMEPLAATSPRVRFRVSGETTVYRKRGYVLLTKATTLTLPAAASPPGDKLLSKPTPLVPKTVARRPATRPAASSRPAGAEATSDDILQELLREKVGRPVPVVRDTPSAATAPSVAPGAGRGLAAGRGAMVVDRLVRIVPELTGSWWQARFEADNTLREPPMRLLPCGLLERAEGRRASRPSGETGVLRVSGLITHYRGRRYLLLRKLLRERGLGRF